ncbi:MAG: hypothetical protein JW774_07225, partial [Candidatus Aureabacteria bacterium]|nr:hypothetical protein [Candidatus Auribacterota bacterium]
SFGKKDSPGYYYLLSRYIEASGMSPDIHLGVIRFVRTIATNPKLRTAKPGDRALQQVLMSTGIETLQPWRNTPVAVAS